MTPPRPTSPGKRPAKTRKEQALARIAGAVEAEAAAAAERIAAVAAAREYSPGDGEEALTWAEITEALGEPHTSHVIAHYGALLNVEVTRRVTVAPDAPQRDATYRRRRRTGATQ